MSKELFDRIAKIGKRIEKLSLPSGLDKAGALEQLARISHGDNAGNAAGAVDLGAFRELQELREQVAGIAAAAPFRKHHGSFTFIDLFCGVGGIRLAAQQNGGRCVFSSEWDRHARETYFANFGEYPYGDINQYAGQDMDDAAIGAAVPDHDLLVGGFPCQPFSRAGVASRQFLGRAHGFECETQGTLFFNIAKIVQVKRPRAVFLENVQNLVRHNKGETFKIIERTFHELGYTFAYKVVNANTMVPQGRVRCYMVAFRDGQEFEFPDFSGDPLPLRSILEEHAPASLTISERSWQSHKDRLARNKGRGVGFGANIANLDKPSRTILARYYKDGSECLVPQEGKPPRMLSPRECARLQGFPEEFILHASNNRAYRQFGNSVAVPVVARILERVAGVLAAEQLATGSDG